MSSTTTRVNNLIETNDKVLREKKNNQIMRKYCCKIFHHRFNLTIDSEYNTEKEGFFQTKKKREKKQTNKSETLTGHNI